MIGDKTDKIKEKQKKYLPGISLVLLCYQEAENLKVLLPQIRQHLDDSGEEYEIIVVDTQKPTDDTRQVCAAFDARYINQEEPHFGGAFRTGIKHARHEKFLIMDSDGSHRPEYIPAIITKYNEGIYDIVIGSRYVKGGKTFDSKTSVLMSRTLNTIFRLCLGIRAKDISTDYRMYSTSQLKRVRLTCENYDVLQEVLLKLKLKKLRKTGKNLSIGEVPIVFDKRLFGNSKRQLAKFIGSYIKTLIYLTGIRIRHAAT